jgi:hypothetical protein
VEVLKERCPTGRGCNIASMPYYDVPQCPMLKVVPLTRAGLLVALHGEDHFLVPHTFVMQHTSTLSLNTASLSVCAYA